MSFFVVDYTAFIGFLRVFGLVQSILLLFVFAIFVAFCFKLAVYRSFGAKL